MEFISAGAIDSSEDASMEITDMASLKTLRATGAKIAIFFWAQWHEPSKAGGALQEAFSLLAKKYASKGLKFYLVEAEAVPDVSEAFGVSVVPTYVTLSGLTEVGKLEGVNPTEVSKLVKALAECPVQAPVDLQELLTSRLEAIINTAPVMIFMKGNPDAPKCKFSRQLVELLKEERIPFHHFDILSDEEVRQGLKKHSDWPTYPQVYVNGALTGGLDILKELKQEGPLREQLDLENLVPPPQQEVPLVERLSALVRRSKVMLFMKGNRDEPKCGFSRTIVGLLNEHCTGSSGYDTFDILEDEEVRQGLKSFSDWPTFPQLYIDGDLVGGLDIVQEMIAEGELQPMVQ